MLVAPFTGAWIEMATSEYLTPDTVVAPFTGAWIEIRRYSTYALSLFRSLPSRERGLKYLTKLGLEKLKGRSLHGSVD